MSLHFRAFEHLVPRGLAWRLSTVGKRLRQLFEGLAPVFEHDREFADDVYLDLFPLTTRELAEWEAQYGLEPAASDSEATRRAALAAEWAATGGQSPAYIEGVLQAAGFDVYVHEWWFTTTPTYTARDPRDYTDQPLIGSVQCTPDGESDQPQCTADNEPDQPQCDAFLQNDPHYFVNLDLTPRAPPPIPDDSDFWPFFLYIGGEVFGDLAVVPIERKASLERLIQKLKPAQNWIVTLITYDGVFDDSFDSSFA
jgi:uncharacterized protein YmfQ (DUF2313 family)